MAAKKSKPPAYRNFEKLTKQLMAVPKTAIDKEIKKYDERKAAKAKSSKKKGG